MAFSDFKLIKENNKEYMIYKTRNKAKEVKELFEDLSSNKYKIIKSKIHIGWFCVVCLDQNNKIIEQ